MKLKFWQFEYDFDREDAKIVIPILILLVVITGTELPQDISIFAMITYYLLLFFGASLIDLAKQLKHKLFFRCPACKSKRLILQGYQGYRSDEHYPYYLCKDCETTSVLLECGLVKVY